MANILLNKGNCIFKGSVIFSFLIMMLLSLGCGDNRLVYTNNAFNIRLRYPSDWEKKEYFGESIVMFLRPKISFPEEGDIALNPNIFIDNLSIAIEDIEEGMSLQEYSNDVMDIISLFEEMKGTYVDILFSGQTQISGKPAYRVVYTLTQYEFSDEFVRLGAPDMIQAEGASFQILQTWVIHRGRAYLFTYTAQRESYQSFLDGVESILRSVRLS